MSNDEKNQEKKQVVSESKGKESLPAIVRADALRPDLSPKRDLIREVRVGWEKIRRIKIYNDGESTVEKIETTYRLLVEPASWKIATFVAATIITGGAFAIFLKIW